jgi:hypothetical protein
MVILLLCIPYIIYFFCIKYCYPYTDTIQTFEYTSNSCDHDDVNETKMDETKQDEKQVEKQDENQDEKQDEKK